MKKVLLFFVFVSVLFSSEINWVSYKQALSMPKDKPMFVFVSTTHCKFCKRAYLSMNSNPNFVEFINNKFIPVYISQDKDFTPVHLVSQVTPTFYVLDKNENYLMEPIRGAQPLNYMFKALNRAEYQFKRD